MLQPVLANLLALPQQNTRAIFRVLHAKKSRDNLEGTGVLAPVAAWRGKHLICCYCKGGKHLAHRKFPSLWESPTGVDLNKFQQSIFGLVFFFLLFKVSSPPWHWFCIATACKEKLFFVSGLDILFYKVVLAGRNCAKVWLFGLTFFMPVVCFRLAVLSWCFPGDGFQSKFSGWGEVKKNRK